MRASDELNNMTTEYVEYDIDTYFDAMDITEEQKEERQNAAEDIWWVLLLLFALIRSSIEDGDLNYAFIYDTFQESYKDTVNRYAPSDDYINEYVGKFTRNTLDTTWDHMDLTNPDDYWTSSRRALGIALNEANAILNYEDLQRAIEEGKNVKTWITQKDNRVRDSHKELDGKTIGIMEYFKVGSSLLLFPCDEVHCMNVRDIANCRCYAKAGYDPKYNTIQNEESRKGLKGTDEETAINREKLSNKTLKERLSVLDESEDVKNKILNRSIEILGHRSGTHYEDLAYINSINSKSKINKTYDYYDEETKTSQCIPNDKMVDMINDSPLKSIIGIHNHPASGVPSIIDVVNGYKYKYGIVLAHNGYIFKYSVSKEIGASYLSVDRQLAKYENALYNGSKQELEEALKELSGYGVDIQVIP